MGNGLVNQLPNTRNISEFLNNSFSLEELKNLSFFEPSLERFYTDSSEVDIKSKYVREMIDFALRRGAIDALLAAAKAERPQIYEQYAPYFITGPALMNESKGETLEISAGSVLPDNSLGKGLVLGGLYQKVPLRIVAHDWAEYGNASWVRSGWLFIPQWTPSHAVAFFKVHVLEGGTGYIHITDVSDPVHTIWLATSGGLKIEKEFHYVAHPVDVWHF